MIIAVVNRREKNNILGFKIFFVKKQKSKFNHYITLPSKNDGWRSTSTNSITDQSKLKRNIVVVFL